MLPGREIQEGGPAGSSSWPFAEGIAKGNPSEGFPFAVLLVPFVTLQKEQGNNPSVSFADSSLKVNCHEVAREAGLDHYTREPFHLSVSLRAVSRGGFLDCHGFFEASQ